MMMAFWLKSFSSFTQLATRMYYTFLAKRDLGSFGSNLRVNKKCIFGKTVKVGNNCCFNGMITTGKGEVVFGDNFSSGVECMIVSQNHNYEGEKIPYDSTFIYKKITIGDNVIFGNRVIDTGNVNIGEGAVITTGSLVCKDVPRFAIVAGNPAKVVKYRNVENF